MGVYSEYLDRGLSADFDALTQERRAQLLRISGARGGRDVLVFAADLTKERAANTIGYMDHLPISDQLANLQGDKLDLILETPGGSGESAEEIVRIIRDRYSDVAVIVPGWAKSAGTIMAMAADEILMGPTSALGPIDAQLMWQGKRFSAHALIEGLEKIKAEVESSGSLNRAYIPLLQGLSPGELQSAQNALDFAQDLVTRWLAAYKFKDWVTHSSDGRPVTEEDKTSRAKVIAEQLCDHGRWLTHGRSIRMEDLHSMRLRVTNYAENDELYDALSRYYTLLRMSFENNIYKIYETPTSQIIKAEAPSLSLPIPAVPPSKASRVEFDLRCGKCGHKAKVVASPHGASALGPGETAFPTTNRLKCPDCQTEHDLTRMRQQIEAQLRRPIV